MREATYLEGQLLLAMPGMTDPRFERAVIFICSHSEEGAMGLVVNQPIGNLGFADLMQELDIDVVSPPDHLTVQAGGPVESGRGFVLHSADYAQDSTLVISQTLALTATVDILKAIANHQGPKNHLIVLGYAGWGAGQLETEIQQNAWLNTPANDEILFYTELEDKWPRAVAMMGIDVSLLSSEAGHA